MKRVVLLIDPDADRRSATAGDLRGAGFIVTEAPDGERAMRRMGALLPHIIVLEMEMPGMSGREVLTALGKNAKLARIPVIALSVDGAGEWPASVKSVLREPHDPADLVHGLRQALGTSFI